MDPVVFLAIPNHQHKYTIIWNFQGFKDQILSDQNGAVKFGAVKINVGGGYNSNTGTFTSPSDGYYTFHCSLTSYNVSNPCSSTIVKNGNQMIGNEVGGNMATFHMNTNDRTWIKANSNCNYIVNYHSSFSGFKIE
jgi:hypothetical protein